MSKERFITDKRAILDKPYAIRDYRELINQEEICDLLNELSEENEQLKTELENTISISYLKEVLQSNLEWWRKEYNPIDESLVIEINMIKSIAEDLGVELE